MIKLLISAAIILSEIAGFANDKFSGTQDFYRNVLDSVVFYKFNPSDLSWSFSGVNQYFYNAGNLDSIIGRDVNRIPKTLSEYRYNQSGKIEEAWSFVKSSNQWTNFQLHNYYYDDSQFLIQRIVKNWISEQWINLNNFHYFYDENNLFVSYYRSIWKENQWVPFSIDSIIYDDQNRSIERYAVLASNKNFITRMLYFYESTGLSNYRTRQDFIGNTWVNVSKENFSYDQCGNHSETVSQKWIGGEWVNDTKSIPFSHIEFVKSDLHKKIAICHNGHTIYIAKSALKAHLAHGDCIGECTVEKKAERRGFDEKEKPKTLPFIIYPNPAREKITIKFDKDECEDSQRVELTDFYGKLLKTFSIKDNSDLTIYRENLPSGEYYVRLVGKDVYSAVVIFE